MINSIRHIVLFKIRDGITEEKQGEAIKLLKELGKDNPSILEWTIEKSLDTRKGIIIIENSLFKSEEDLNSFRSFEKHIKTGEFMREISDWIIGDYFETTKNEL